MTNSQKRVKNSRKDKVSSAKTNDTRNVNDGSNQSEGTQDNTKKRRRRSTGGTYDSGHHDTENSPETINNAMKKEFRKLSVDNKLVALFEMMADTKADTKILRNKVGNLENTIERVTSENEKIVDRIQVLEYKSIDLEARSRRNNLVFRGHPEIMLNENCEEIIYKLLREHLKLETIDIKINRAHRIGAPSRGKVRPIIVSFVHYQDIEKILENAYKLSGTRFGINRDYPKEITDARSKLWPQFKQAKADKNNKAYIAYPAKLIVNRKVVRDEFPDWNDVMRQSRTDHGQTTQKKSFQSRISSKNTTTANSDEVFTTRNPFETLMEIDSSDSESDNDETAANESGAETEDPQEEETDDYSLNMRRLERSRHMSKDEPLNLSQASGACGGPGDTNGNSARDRSGGNSSSRGGSGGTHCGGRGGSRGGECGRPARGGPGEADSGNIE